MRDEWANGKTPIKFKECKDMKFISEEELVCLKAFLFFPLPHNVINQFDDTYYFFLQTYLLVWARWVQVFSHLAQDHIAFGKEMLLTCLCNTAK